jgi:hypothetical protein
MSDLTLDVLVRGREHISPPGGWCQTVHITEQKSFSAIGACAIDTGVLSTSAQDAAVCCLFAMLPWYWRLRAARLKQADVVARFNNTPARSQREIVALFDGAIRKRQGEGRKRAKLRLYRANNALMSALGAISYIALCFAMLMAGIYLR